MVQITHHTNRADLPDFPTELKVKDVNLYLHDSLMFCTHDYSCPVCRENHALKDSDGIMQPCDKCSEKYGRIKKKRKSLLQRVGWV